MRDVDLTINEELEDSLLEVVTHHYRRAWLSFQTHFNVIINWGDITPFVFEEGHKSHIFYHIEMLNRKLNEGAE